MSTLNVYSYYDATGVRKYADFNDVIFTGTWASTGTYLASAMQVANYGNSQYYAIVDSVNKNPTTQPTRWQPIRYWSPFILVSQGGGGTNTDETLQIAISGSNTAVLAYGYALAAQSSANAALDVAVQAYGVATAGTQTASTALGIANEALSIAVTGTNALIVEQGTRSAADQFLQSQITVEAGTRSSADQVLLNRIYTEQGTRSSADQFLQSQIYVEAGTRSSADQQLQNQVVAEAGTRSSADQSLLNMFYAEQGTRSEADQTLLNLVATLSGSVNGSATGLIIAEAGTRSEADQFIQNQIYVEAGTRSEADQQLQNQIYVEAGTRSEADQFLQNQIYVEQGTRSSADQVLLNLIVALSGSVNGSATGLIIAEAGTRSEADQTLLSLIYVEQGTRSEAIQSLQTSITTESGTRSEADQFLQNQIYVEQGTRSEANQAGLNALYAEQGTRSEADQTLLNMVYAEQGTRSSADQNLLNLVVIISGSSSGSVSFLVAAEAGTRSEADQFLQNQIYVEAGTRSEADQTLLNLITVLSGSVNGSLYGMLSIEQGTRSEADQFLQNQIYVEAGTRSEADQTLLNLITVLSGSVNGSATGLIVAESGTRSEADQFLQNQIYVEQGTRSEADQNLLNLIVLISGSSSGSVSFLVAAEAGTRSEADQVLANSIITEQGTRSSADQTLANAIVTEQGTRSESIQILANAIVTEQGTRSESVQVLTNSIVIEQGTRSSADQNLLNLVYAEQGTRSESIQVLTNAIITEQGTRSEADQTLANAIITEQGTRSESVQILANAIVTEQGTRSSADQALLNLIVLITGSSSGSLSYLVTAEAGTRSEADQVLANSIITEQGTRSSADQVLYNSLAAVASTADAAYELAQLGTVAPALSTLPDVSIPVPSTNQVLLFNGSLWVSSDIPASVSPAVFTYFLDDTASGTLAANTLTTVPAGTPEIIDTVSSGAGVASPIESYLSTYLNRTILNAGIWEFNTYASVSSALRPANIVYEAYLLSLSGIQTFLFSGTSPSVAATAPTLYTSFETHGTYASQITDKLLLKYYALRVGTTVNVSIYHDGSEHYSHVHTPLGYSHNDLSGLQGGNSTDDQFYHTTLSQNGALAGSAGVPSSSNPYVTAQDLVYQIGTETAARLAVADTANGAYSIAVDGTNAAASAQSTASSAYALAVSGTSTANAAYTLAQIGTNVGTNAYNLATSGSNVAWAAYALASATGTAATPAVLDWIPAFSGSGVVQSTDIQSFTKTTADDATWNNFFKSTIGYLGAVECSTMVASVSPSPYGYFGLTTNTSAFTASSDSFYFSISNTGYVGVTVALVGVYNYGTITANDVLKITYDGNFVKFWVNDRVVYTVLRTTSTAKLYLIGVMRNNDGSKYRAVNFKPAQSAVAQAYANKTAPKKWTPIFVGGVTYRYDANSYWKYPGVDDWTGQVYSTEGYIRSAYCSAKALTTGAVITFGLSSTPTSSSDRSEIDYAFQAGSDNNVYIMERGSTIGTTYGTWNTSTRFDITYDGTVVKYFVNGVVVRTVARAVGVALYFNGCFYSVATQGLIDVDFGQLLSPTIYTADQAFTLAQIGTNTGTNAYNLATAGSNVAWAAYTLAVRGTLTPVGAVYSPGSGSQTVALDCSQTAIHIVNGHGIGTAITFTMTGDTNNQPIIVSVAQGTGTVSTIGTWFSTIRWAGGSAPTLTATVSKRDTFGFLRTGSNTYDGFTIGQNC